MSVQKSNGLPYSNIVVSINKLPAQAEQLVVQKPHNFQRLSVDTFCIENAQDDEPGERERGGCVGRLLESFIVASVRSIPHSDDAHQSSRDVVSVSSGGKLRRYQYLRTRAPAFEFLRALDSDYREFNSPRLI